MRHRVKADMEQGLLDIGPDNSLFICLECLGDPMLKEFKSLPTSEVTCAACRCSTRRAVCPLRIASFIRRHLPTHFSIDDGLYDGYEMTLSEIVGKAIRCDYKPVCDAIALELSDPDSDEDDFYWHGQVYCHQHSPFDDEEHERWWVVGDWERVAYELTYERRFFNERASKLFEALLHEALTAKNPECLEAPAVIKILPTGTELYRARIASDIDEARHFKSNPSIELSAPPPGFAKNNRMSAVGIPWMYLARDIPTCVSEVLPKPGNIVVAGKFTSTVPLSIFDFNTLSGLLKHEDLSLFSPDHEERSNHQKLFRYLHDEIARRVERTDTGYVVTQAFAEFIRFYAPHSFDGISFRSVQNPGGINVVLFAKDEPDCYRSPGRYPQFDLTISCESVTTHFIED